MPPLRHIRKMTEEELEIIFVVLFRAQVDQIVY
jgi:hypothetical protein